MSNLYVTGQVQGCIVVSYLYVFCSKVVGISTRQICHVPIIVHAELMVAIKLEATVPEISKGSSR